MKPIQSLQNMLPEDGCGIVLSALNRRYLTGFFADDGILLITKTAAFLLEDFRYIEAAREKADGCEIILLDDANKQMRQILGSHGVKTACIEQKEVTLERYEALKKALPGIEIDTTGDFNRLILLLRMKKTPQELTEIKSAQKITDDAFAALLGFIKPGLTEREVAAELEYEMKKRGSQYPSFDTIAVSGENSSRPHGVPGSRKLQAGDFLTLDFGAVVNSYHSDMTRTVAIGKVNDEQKKVYDTVLEAQKRALEAISAGKTGREIDAVARAVIDGAGYKGRFGHGLGHSVGLYIHEEPRFSPLCNTVMEKGMVMTVEPGIYLEGRFGVRIEDMVLITPTGCEDLTQSPKELIEL